MSTKPVQQLFAAWPVPTSPAQGPQLLRHVFLSLSQLAQLIATTGGCKSAGAASTFQKHLPIWVFSVVCVAVVDAVAAAE